ncbi:MAG: trigger factor [Candidatus Cyclobacteriaceae bacterium M2_1C_046]
MDIQLDKKSPIEGSIKITLNQDDYQPKVDEKIRDYAKKANIKGFRPGKVPPGIIKRMYGTSIKVEEVNQVLSKSLTDYIKENNLKILGDPLPDRESVKNIDWENQKELTFKYDIGLVDEFDYDVSPKVKLKKYKIEADKKVIDETIDNLRKQFGPHSHPDTVAEGDAVEVEAVQKDGELKGEGQIQLEEVEKKYQKEFIGAKVEQTIEVELAKAIKDENTLSSLLDIPAEEAKDLKGKFSLTIKKVHHTEPAEVNQELFDKTFGKGVVEDEKAFRDKIKTTIEENYNRETEYLLERDIRNHFIEKTKVNTPDEFLKNWLVESNEGKLSKEEVEKNYDQYLKDMKWDLITNRIATDKDIKAEHEDVKGKAKEMIIQQLGGPAVAQQLGDNLDSFADNYLKGQDGKNYMQVYNQVMQERIMDFIKENITLTEKNIDVEEFKKIASN